MVEGSVGATGPGVVDEHGTSLAVVGRGGVEGIKASAVANIDGMIPEPVEPTRPTVAPVDYRLAREATLQAWREGDLDLGQICDAQPELRRNAEFCGTISSRDCPVCEAERLVEVTYVFGPRLPKHGRCVTTDKEMRRLEEKPSTYRGYVVEVCNGCGWNHLARSALF